MPKSRGRKHHKSPQPPVLCPHKGKKLLSTAARLIGAGFLATCTVVGAAVIFVPRITVEASGPFDASPEPPIVFTIANISIVPLADVKPRLGLCAVSLNYGIADDNPKPPFNKCTEKSTGVLAPTSWQHSRMEVDERDSVTWNDAFHNQTPGILDYADIIITVAYRPWIVPWHMEKSFRFVTRKLSDGKIHWLSRPLAD